MWFEILLVFILFKFKNVPTFLEFGLFLFINFLEKIVVLPYVNFAIGAEVL